MGIYMLLPAIAGMGAVAGLAVLAVLLGRCFLRRGPKLFCYLLWSVVLFRLLCPVSVPSMFSALRLFDVGRAAFTPSKPTAFPALLGLQADLCHLAVLDVDQVKMGDYGSYPQGFATGETSPSGDADFFDTVWGYMDARALGGAYDLWLAWEGRFDAVYREGQPQEIAAPAKKYSRILLPAPPAMLLEDEGLRDTLAKSALELWEQEGLLEHGAPSSFYGLAAQDVQAGRKGGDVPAGQAQVPLWLVVATWVWLSGVALMLLYSLASLFLLRRRLVGAVRLEGNIYQSDYISSPFVIGLFSPRIYLPSALCGKEREYILMHEQTHIRRGDYIFRLLAFAALTLHWFNPLVWLAFYLSGKDMEMACDEAVMKRMKEDIRADYSASLLGLATGRHFVLGTYLAFGGGDVKGRIKNIMHYKKPTVFWVVFAAVLVSGTVCAFGSDPKVQEEAGGREILGMAASAGVDICRNVGEAEPEKADGNENVLTVYSLTDGAFVQELLGDFAARYPEIKICHETGEDGLLATEQTDALTARLLAGTGPDVLFLDGLPARSYQADGLLADMTKTLAPLQGGLQQNIVSAYTEEGKVFMLPVCYLVPFALMEEQNAKAMESLSGLTAYMGRPDSGRKVDLDGYSWADLLEMAYYNYAPQFIREDGTVTKENIKNFLLYIKWIGDSSSVSGETATHRYFEEKLGKEDLDREDAGVLFLPLCGMDDLYTYSAQVGEMLREGRKMQQVGGLFFPEGLVGINAWSANKEQAALFVQAVFSEEMQEGYADSGFCVNAQVFQEKIADWAAAWEAEADETVTFGLGVKQLAGQMEKALEVGVGQSADAAILQVLTEEAMGYFLGETTLHECVEAIAGRIW